MTPAVKRIVLTIGAVSLLAAAGGAQYAARHVIPTILAPEASKLPSYVGPSVDPRIVKRLLGVRLVVADLIWIDTLIKSDLEREAEPFTTFYRAFKTIVTLDSDNLYAYYVAGLYLSVIKDDIRGATAILREGAQWMEAHPYRWANAWVLPFTLGYNLIFEEHEIEEGSKWIRMAADMPGVPAHIVALGQRVSTEAGRLEVASRVLGAMYRNVTRAEEKTRIEKKMSEIAARQDLAELNEKFQQFISSTGAYAMPKPRQFQLFLKSTGHPRRDLLGRPLELDATGKIVSRSGQ